MSLLPVLSRAMQLVQGPHGCMLTFHRVAQHGAWAQLPNRDFYVDLDFLDLLLTHLRRSGATVVTISEMLEALGKPSSRARLVNVSIDDCYRDTHDAVVPMFRAHDVPVTLFVTTGIPDGTHLLPWNGLERIIAERSAVRIGDDSIPTATGEAKRKAFAEIWTRWEAAGDVTGSYLAFCAAHGADPRALAERDAITWDMLRALDADRYVEIGAHTCSHPRVSALDDAAAEAEIVGSARRLEEVLGRRVEHFAFPYGRSADCGERDFAIARRGGLRSSATTVKGLCRPGCDPYRLPRNTLNGARQGLLAGEALLSGFAGVAARVLGRI